jgi:hypothetical protein
LWIAQSGKKVRLEVTLKLNYSAAPADIEDELARLKTLIDAGELTWD